MSVANNNYKAAQYELGKQVFGTRQKKKTKNIDMPCLPAQRTLLSAQSRLVAFVGGFGSGKTRAAVYKSLQLGFLNAPCVGLFLQPNYTIIRDTGIESFKTILGELEIPYKLHTTNNVLRVADTFDILLRSGEESDKIVGTNAGWGIIDEPGKQSEEVGKNVLARLRDPRAKLQQLVLTGTPEGFNWFYEWTNLPDCFVVRAKTTDNPFLSDNYITDLSRRFSPEEVRAYINGEFVRFEGGWYKTKPRVIPYEAVGGIKVFKKPEAVSDQLVIGVDTAGGLGRDSTAIALIDKRDKSLVATYVSSEATVDSAADIVNRIAEMYTVRDYGEVKSSPVIMIEVNGIGRPMYQRLMSLGLGCYPVNTTEGTRYAGLLATRNMVEAGVLEGPEELLHECENLVVEEQKFKGPKDLSMAIGFALNYIEKSPYVKPIDRQNNTFRMEFKPRIRGTI
jgi:hypothetical protein